MLALPVLPKAIRRHTYERGRRLVRRVSGVGGASEKQQHLDVVASADVVNWESPSTREPWEARVNG